MNKILFDANSTNPISSTIAVAPGACVLINAWNLGPGEVAEVWRLLLQSGDIPAQTGGACDPFPIVTGGEIVEETPYVPCNTPVQVGQTATQNITSLVLSQPGYYQLRLTPAALGTAVVEAVTLTGADACAQAANACCCTPQQNWAGSSLNPCLTITPGGPNNMEPVFDLDACCLVQQIVTPGIPNLADTIIVFQGGACVRSTLQDVVDLVFVCGTLGAFPLQPLAVGDTVVAVDNAAQCKRLDLDAAVTGLETPWTGISLTPALTITPGGINGHAPQFAYDLCADLQALPACACVPNPGDLVPIIQDIEGNITCVLATWPTVDVCEQMALLPIGVNIPGDTFLVREAGGACKAVPVDGIDICTIIGNFAPGALAVGDVIPVRDSGGVCKLVLASTIGSGFDGGTINNPILGPDGSCAAPTYSFTTDPASGMLYEAGVPAVTIGFNNCSAFVRVGDIVRTEATNGDFFEVGASIVGQAGTNVSLSATAGTLTFEQPTFGTRIVVASGVLVRTNSIDRVIFRNDGAWELALNQGLAGQAVTSQGPGLPPIWATPSASVTFPLHAPTNNTPQYSFIADTTAGMTYSAGGSGNWNSGPNFGVFNGSDWQGSAGLHLNSGASGANELFLQTANRNPGNVSRLNITGGRAFNTGDGGQINITGGQGDSGTGGSIQMIAGASVVGGNRGGDITIRAGNSDTGGPGNVLITAGQAASPNAPDGHIRLRTNQGGPGSANVPAITMDHHGSVQYGDPYVFVSSAWAHARSFWYGVAGDAVTPTGQEIRIWGGPGQSIGVGGDGGNLDLAGGNASSGGNNDGGQLLLRGGGLAGAGVKGYVQIENTGLAGLPPVVAPNVVSGYNPVIFQDVGGVLTLWGWCVSAGAWRSVVLV